MGDATSLSLSKQAASSFIAQAVGALAGFIALLVFSRELGPDGIGDYYYILAISQVLMQVTGGLSSTLQKRVSEVGSKTREFVGFALLSHIGLVAVIAPSLLLAKSYLPLGGEGTTGGAVLVAVFGGLIGFNGVYTLATSVYSGLGHPSRTMWSNAGRGVTVPIFQYTFYILGYGVIGLLLGQIVASAVFTVVLAALIRVVPTFPSKDTIRSAVRFSTYSIPSSILNTLYKRADAIIIGAFIGSASVGYYEAAYRLTLPAMMFASSISQPLNVKVSGLDSIGEAVLPDIQNAAAYVLALALPLLFGGAAIAEPLMTVAFGEEFAAGSHLLVLVLGIAMLNVSSFPLTSAISGVDRPDIGLLTRIASLVVYIPAVAIGAAQYGAPGVLVATLLAEVVQLLTAQYAMRGLFGTFITPKPVVAQAVAAGVMYGVVEQVEHYVNAGTVSGLATAISAGAVVYGVLLLTASTHARTTAKSVVSTAVN